MRQRVEEGKAFPLDGVDGYLDAPSEDTKPSNNKGATQVAASTKPFLRWTAEPLQRPCKVNRIEFIDSKLPPRRHLAPLSAGHL